MKHFPSMRYHKSLEPKVAKNEAHEAELKKLGYDRHAVIFAPEAKEEQAPAVKSKGRRA